MTRINVAPAITCAVVISAVLASLTACTAPAPGVLGDNQQILSSCPKNAKLATLLDADESGSRLSAVTTAQDQAIIESEATRTAVCGGHLTITMFSSSSGSTATVYDDTINIPGATDNARLLQVPDKVKSIMKVVRSRWRGALATLPQAGTDVDGIYRLASEYKQQLGSGYSLKWDVLTDGFNNLGGVDLESPTLSSAQAEELAAQVPVPDLRGASITVAGLGRVAGNPAASSTIDALVTFYDALCARTHAAKCVSVTDWR
jgi:hypothetical protein